MLRGTMLSLVCILILASACQVNPRASAKPEQEGLSRYVGMDLRELGFWKRTELKRSIYRLTGVKVKTGMLHLRPWWVFEYPDGMTRWILFEAYEGHDIPDRSHVRVHLFDKGWEYLGSSAFETGYEVYLREARLVWKSVVESYILEIQETAGWQFYAIIDDRIALIRLEDREHNMLQRSYIREKPWTGPATPKRTAEQWLQSLDSENPCEVLETLVWLSGRHLSPEEERLADWAQESVEDSRLVQTVRNSPELKKKLLILRESPNLWIRQAAELAFTIQTASPH